jgi:hypothetical protein
VLVQGNPAHARQVGYGRPTGKPSHSGPAPPARWSTRTGVDATMYR